MPIYEYRCRQCGKVFDKFVRSITSISTLEVECPQCQSKDCKKNISLFGTSGLSSSQGASDSSCAPSG